MARQDDARNTPNPRTAGEVNQKDLEDPSFTTIKMSEESLEELFRSDGSSSPHEEEELFNSASFDDPGFSKTTKHGLGTREARKKALEAAVARARANSRSSLPEDLDPELAHAGTLKLKRKRKGGKPGDAQEVFTTIKLNQKSLPQEEEPWPSWRFVVGLAVFTLLLLGVAGVAAYYLAFLL